MKVIICTWRIREWELQILNWSSSVQPEIVPLFTISFQCLKKKFKSWQVYDWLAKWLIMSGYMDLRRPRVYRRSNVGLVLSTVFSGQKLCVFPCSRWNHFLNSAGNGLVLLSQQAIIWTSDDPFVINAYLMTYRYQCYIQDLERGTCCPFPRWERAAQSKRGQIAPYYSPL